MHSSFSLAKWNSLCLQIVIAKSQVQVFWPPPKGRLQKRCRLEMCLARHPLQPAWVGGPQWRGGPLLTPRACNKASWNTSHSSSLLCSMTLVLMKRHRKLPLKKNKQKQTETRFGASFRWCLMCLLQLTGTQTDTKPMERKVCDFLSSTGPSFDFQLKTFLNLTHVFDCAAGFF